MYGLIARIEKIITYFIQIYLCWVICPVLHDLYISVCIQIFWILKEKLKLYIKHRQKIWIVKENEIVFLVISIKFNYVVGEVWNSE